MGFNKIVFGFLLNQPPAANQNPTKVHLLTLTNNSTMKKNCCRSPWLSEISMVGWGDNTIISSDRSSCTDDGLLYIRAAATFSDFEHLCLSILLQVSL